MKSFAQGLITGSMLIVAIFLFIGASYTKEEFEMKSIGRYELNIIDDEVTLFDTANGNWYMIDDSDPNQYAWDPIVNRMVIKYSKGK